MNTNKIATIPNYWIIPGTSIEKDFVLRRLDGHFKLGFSQTNPDYLIHKAFCLYRKTNRIRNASTKTKSEVRGGGRKPWPQKGRGKARAGSIRSPLWRGGGVTFGPKPIAYNPKLNNREYDRAFRVLLHEKQKRILAISLFEGLTNSKLDISKSIYPGKTKYAKQVFTEIFEKNNINSKNVISKQLITIVVSAQEYKILEGTLFLQSIKNLKNVNLVIDNQLSINDVIRSSWILMTAYSSYNLTLKDLSWKKVKR
uniref:Large ribosomal subunit protein uL4c n=1 Tax=Nannochloropsis granulata TaxID=43926 RepID=T1RH69_9STRA|nr:ribosomal protein L4 [Nannochloropsis granulata]AGI98767.1 ribosomal protein L4 [Nannochloropsis granulata]|eukprot:529_rpl4_cp